MIFIYFYRNKVYKFKESITKRFNIVFLKGRL